MTEPRFPLTEDQRRTLMTEMSNFDGALGPDFEVACNATPADHVHVRRFGMPGEAHTRVVVMSHQSGNAAAVYIHPTEARALAAALLNMADEIDGTTPLVFFPRDPEAGE